MASVTSFARARSRRAVALGIFATVVGGCSDNHAEVVRLRGSCAAGVAADCNALGDRYYAGRGVLRDDSEAARLFGRACENAVGKGCASLGLMHLVGRGMKPDTTQARVLFDRGCTNGGPAGCANLGRLMARDTGTTRDIAAAVTLLTKACDGSDPLGCAELGALVASGDGVPPDPAKARRLFEQSCTDIETVGCGGLGRLHADGTGVEQSDSLAKVYFTRGCEQHAAACVLLGRFAEQGRGGPVDYEIAGRQYRAACQRREGEGCFRLSVMYETGAGAYRDPERAADTRKRACTLGYAPACSTPKAKS